MSTKHFDRRKFLTALFVAPFAPKLAKALPYPPGPYDVSGRVFEYATYTIPPAQMVYFSHLHDPESFPAKDVEYP